MLTTLNDIPLTYFINDYTELCNLLLINVSNTPNYSPPPSTATTLKALLAYKTQYTLPKSVRYHSAKNHLIENLMFRAIQHWCCISFKIVPIELELIKKDTPKTILYCVAAISMMTTSSTSQRETTTTTQKNKNNKVKKVYDKSAEGFKKDVSFYFYETAVNHLKDILFPNEDEEEESISSSVMAIQSYFCLSYTANLLRLTSEQRTWHYLACDQLKSKIKYIDVSPGLRQCWDRWYYIDTWVALSLNMECLLPDELPFSIKRPIYTPSTAQMTTSTAEDGTTIISTNNDSITTATAPTTRKTTNITDKHGTNCCIISNDTLYQFSIMAQYMRRFNRCIQTSTLPHFYDNLTYELESWFSRIEYPNLHLKTCYYSMRLVILFSLLQQSDIYYVDFNLLLDGLNCTLQILQGLQDLKLMKCDQSTYHHMFFAIHKTLKSIHHHIRRREEFKDLEPFAKQQFQMNLCILEGTDAFMNDLYGMRAIGAIMEDDLYTFGYIEDTVANTKRAIHVFRTKVTSKSVKKAKKIRENKPQQEK